jgi:hypothetical protein
MKLYYRMFYSVFKHDKSVCPQSPITLSPIYSGTRLVRARLSFTHSHYTLLFIVIACARNNFRLWKRHDACVCSLFCPCMCYIAVVVINVLSHTGALVFCSVLRPTRVKERPWVFSWVRTTQALMEGACFSDWFISLAPLAFESTQADLKHLLLH